MRRLIVGLVVVGVCVAAASPVVVRSAGVSAGPVTLARWAGNVQAVGQDAGSVAWCSQSGGYHEHIHFLRLATRAERRFSAECVFANRIAVGYPSLAWRTPVGGGTNYKMVVFALAGGRLREVAESSAGRFGYGNVVGEPVSDGSTLFYSVLQIVGNEMDCNIGEAACYWRVGGGHVYRVVGGRGVVIPTVPPTSVIAASGGRIATVGPSNRRFGRDDAADVTSAASNGVVRVRDSRNGAVMTSFRPTGVVTEMALTAKYAVVLVEYGAALRVEVYDAASGARVRVVPVASTASQLSASGNLAVFAEGSLIRLLDLRNGSVQDLWRTDPVGLSISGNRLTWGENSKTFKSAKVLTLSLP
jgi:hypothetical protein